MAIPANSSVIFSYLSLDPPAPSPEKSPSEYTVVKTRERLDYARRLGSRKFSPRSEIFLQLYRDAAENALEADDEKQRLPYCTQLYRYDLFIQQNSFLCREASEKQKELEEKLLKLKRLEYYARYGDYLGRELSVLKETAVAHETAKNKELQQYWTTVCAKMRKERTWLNEEGQNLETGNIPTLLAIWHAAADLKLPSERVEWTIEQYAERNLLVHSTVSELIQRGRWTKLAELLYNDAKDLPMTIPPSLKDGIEMMSAIIASLRDEFFKIEEGDEDSPESWRPNEDVENYRKQLRAQPEAKKKSKDAHVMMMVKRAQESANQRKKESDLVDQAIQGKRKASQPYPLGEAMLAKKTKELEKVVGIQSQVNVKEKELDRLYGKRDEAVDNLAKPNSEYSTGTQGD